MKITIEHDGKTLYGELGTITGTRLGREDHGIMSAMVFVDWKGGGVGVGGYSLDTPVEVDGRHSHREGTAFGMDQLIQIMDTVGVSSWEKLKGQHVIVLFERELSWGTSAVGLAGVDNRKVLILRDHADAWKEKEDARG